MKYRKKPVEIEAHRWDGDWEALNAWLDSLGFQDGDDPAMWLDDNDHTLLWIATLEGNMRTPLGWVVIIGVQREAYSCKPDIFEQTHEPLADTDEPKDSITFNTDDLGPATDIDGNPLADTDEGSSK